MVLKLLANHSAQGKVVRCFPQNAWLYSLVTFVLAEALYVNIGITAVFVPSYCNNNAKTFNCKHKTESKKGRKRNCCALSVQTFLDFDTFIKA